MRTSAKALIAGVAALACAGGVYAAAQNVHVMKVALPDGSIAQIHYLGDVAPKVVVAPAADPVALIDAELDAPFAMMDRVAVAMERQQQAMLAQVSAMQASPDAKARTTGGAAPRGVYHYSYVSTSGDKGGCTQSYELTSYGGQQAPREISRQSGDCRGVAPLVKTALPAPPTPPKPLPAAVAKPAPTRISPDSI